jgi:hypothetical protein
VPLLILFNSIILRGKGNIACTQSVYTVFIRYTPNDSYRLDVCKLWHKQYFWVRSEVFTAVTMKNAVFWDVMLCGFCKDRRFRYKIWGFHGGDYEELCLLGCYAVWLLWVPMFRRNLASPSSGWQESVNQEQRYLLGISSQRASVASCS